MHPVLKKLNYREEPLVVAINAPQSFESVLENLPENCVLETKIEAIEKTSFVIAFVTKKTEVDQIAAQLENKLEGDAKVWMCYPKGTSKKYTCDFNRDNGWDQFKAKDLLGVRMVAIDEDWSALRFRKKEFIKKLTRKF
ncbi:MAG: hypothetical protein N4A35_03990 [Flavobacteriales bacterium]|jgi:glycerol-3-phosphate dehydrogenase|nr:hypothetical protein [Flavobacteriales bacterium]